jgi:hypothetical protein
MKEKFACMILLSLIYVTEMYLRTEKLTFHSGD